MSTVLVLHMGALGDSVLTWPILAAIRRSRPQARLVLAGSGARAVLATRVCCEGRALADAAMSLDGADFVCLFADGPTEPLRAKLSEVLGPESEAAESAILSFLGPADSHAHRRLRQVWPGQLWTVDSAAAAGRRVPLRQQWAEQLVAAGAGDLVAALTPAPSFAWPTRPRAPQPTLPRAAQPPGPSAAPERYAVLAPGSGGREKCWPLIRFRQTAAELRDRHGLATVWLLGEVELERGPRPDELTDGTGRVVIAPSLPELAELLAQADLLVGNDSGPGHLAAALGTPTVSVFRRTDPLVWAPAGPSVRTVGEGQPIPAVYDPRACPWEPPAVRDPETAEVLAAVGELLSRASDSGSSSPAP